MIGPCRQRYSQRAGALGLLFLAGLCAPTIGQSQEAVEEDSQNQGYLKVLRVPAPTPNEEPEEIVEVDNAAVEASPTVSAAAMSAIVAAVMSNDLEGLHGAIVEAGCSPNCGDLFAPHSILHRAASSSTVPIVYTLIAAGADMNQRSDPLAWTPLLEALAAANVDVAIYLVEAGADVSLAGTDGTTAPFLADLVGLGNLVPYPPLTLPEAEANSLLLRAVEANNLEVLDVALAAGAKPGATAENGWSALMIGSSNGHAEVVRRLIEADQTIASYREPKGFNALQAALIGVTDPRDTQALLDIMSALLRAGVDRHATKSPIPTPLEIAKAQGLAEPVIALLVTGLPDESLAKPETDGGDFIPVDEGRPMDEQELVLIGYASTNANVRVAPDSKAAVITTVPKGTVLDVLATATKGGWAKLRLPDGRPAYVFGELVSLSPVDEVQYGFACLFRKSDGGADYRVVVGQSSAEAAQAAARKPVGAHNCADGMAFSGDQCTAIYQRTDQAGDVRAVGGEVGENAKSAQNLALHLCNSKREPSHMCSLIEVSCAKHAK